MLRQCLNKKNTHEETECARARAVERPLARKKIQNEKKRIVLRERSPWDFVFFVACWILLRELSWGASERKRERKKEREREREWTSESTKKEKETNAKKISALIFLLEM